MKVINIRNAKNTIDEVYIGRPRGRVVFHFGNPFTHLNYGTATVKVNSREEAVQAFKEWLDGTKWQEIEPQRRQWILDNIDTLRGKTLVCFCKPKSCHGDVIKERLGE